MQETLEVFQQEARRLLRDRRAVSAANSGAEDTKLRKLRQERANLIEAIATVGIKANAGLVERLSRTEAELVEVERRACADGAELLKIADILPRAAERLQRLVADLGNVLRRDVGRARAGGASGLARGIGAAGAG